MNSEKYDLIISKDEYDIDAIKISNKYGFKQIKTDHTRIDLIEIPENIGIYDTLPSPPAKESYQPISFMIATHTTPVTKKGEELRRKIREKTNMEEIIDLYHYISYCFLEGNNSCPQFIKEKSYKYRKEINHKKMNVGLYRAVCDLLPRAEYMEKYRKYPEEDVLEKTGYQQLCNEVKKYFGAGYNKKLDEIYNIALNKINKERVKKGLKIYHKISRAKNL